MALTDNYESVPRSVVPRAVERITDFDYQSMATHTHKQPNTSEDRCISTQDSIRARI